MSERNGEKSRFQINRRRRIQQRARIRELVAASAGEKRTAPAKPQRRAKT